MQIRVANKYEHNLWHVKKTRGAGPSSGQASAIGVRKISLRRPGLRAPGIWRCSASSRGWSRCGRGRPCRRPRRRPRREAGSNCPSPVFGKLQSKHEHTHFNHNFSSITVIGLRECLRNLRLKRIAKILRLIVLNLKNFSI